MPITNELIKTLRDKTGAGMMDCKRALEASNGDLNAAIEYLRKKGAAVSQKRADRVAKEGMIVTHLASDGKTGVIVEVNCETDFVGRSDDFVRFASAVALAVESHKPASPDALATTPTATGKTVSEMLNDLLAKVGEKIEVRRFQLIQSDGGLFGSYTHVGSKIGVLVEFEGLDQEAAAKGTGRDVAMQIAAMNPTVVSREQIANETVERELEIYRTQAKNEGKPDQILDRIAKGKLEKFYQEVCLLEQTFIKDPGKTIREVLADNAKAAGRPVTVKRFIRFHLGEETK
jgi:elongation factor Ts